jgi:hypothetical protein
MKIVTLFASAILGCSLLASAGDVTAAPAAAKTRVAAEPAQREIAYADLETQVGKRITVHTRLGTVRSGLLTKFTRAEIDMKLDEGTELTIPANSIRSLSVPASSPVPSTPGDDSAKKN